jgi:acyl carrier protein
MNVDWERYAATYPAPEFLSTLVEPAVRRGSPPAPDAGLPERIRTAPAGRRAALVEEVVQAQVAGVLGHASGSVSRSRGLTDMGLDSLGAIELRTRLEQAFGRRLPATLAFDHPTVAALAAHLLEGVVSTGSDATGADPEGAPPDGADLESLSKDELAALLAGELAAGRQKGHP